MNTVGDNGVGEKGEGVELQTGGMIECVVAEWLWSECVDRGSEAAGPREHTRLKARHLLFLQHIMHISLLETLYLVFALLGIFFPRHLCGSALTSFKPHKEGTSSRKASRVTPVTGAPLPPRRPPCLTPLSFKSYSAHCYKVYVLIYLPVRPP